MSTRFLHTMLRVGDLQRSIRFYTNVLGMPLIKTIELPNGKLVNMTPAIFALGGATLEIEFNHLCQKLMRGLGVVAIENQARI